MNTYFIKVPGSGRYDVETVHASRVSQVGDRIYFTHKGEVVRWVPAGTRIRRITVTEDLHPVRTW